MTQKSGAAAKVAVSIGMPVFNGEKYLAAALESLAAQSLGYHELIICDNASTDRTREICEEHAARDPRIRYVRNETNIGVLANFNRVAELATGELFMWAACDDLWDGRFIERLAGALRAHPEASLAYCDYDWVGDDEKQIRRGKVRFIADRRSVFDRLVTFNERNARLHNFVLYFLWRNPFLLYGMFRLEGLRRVPPFEYIFSDARHADNLFMLRFLAQERVVVVDELLFHYRWKDRASADSTASYQSPKQTEPKAFEEREIERVLQRRIRSMVAEAPVSFVESRVLSWIVPTLGTLRLASMSLRR